MNEVWISLIPPARTVTYLDMSPCSETRSQKPMWPGGSPSMTFCVFIVESRFFHTAFQVLPSSGLVICPTSSLPISESSTCWLTTLNSSEAAVRIGVSFISGLLPVPSVCNSILWPAFCSNSSFRPHLLWCLFNLLSSLRLTVPPSPCDPRITYLTLSQHLQRCIKIACWHFCFVH